MDNVDSVAIHKDINAYQSHEEAKVQAVKQKNQEWNHKLVQQIEEKKKPLKLDPIEFEMNKKLIMKIQTTKAQQNGTFGSGPLRGDHTHSQILSPMRKSLSQFGQI